MTFIIDGTAGATFPNGSNPQAAPSKVLQVVQGNTTTATSTSSTSFVATNLTASITPLFSTSKILILISTVGTQTSSGKTAYYTIYRNSTNLASTAFSVYDNLFSSGFCWSPVSINYLDNPSTTSSTTYTLYLSTPNSGTAYVNGDGSTATITLMEIAQ